MKNKLSFDDFVKEQFSNYSPNVPAHVWENIVAKRRSKPKGFWWNFINSKSILILTAIVLIGGGIGYISFTGKNRDQIAKSNVVAENSSTSSKSNTSENKQQQIPETNQPSEVTTGNENNTRNIAAPNNDINHFSVNNLSKISSDQKNKIAPANKITTNEAATKTDQSSISESNKIISADRVTSSFIINNARELSDLKKLNKSYKLPDCPAIKDAAGNKKYWEVYAGPDYAFNNYKSFSDTASSNYLNKRKASTAFSSAFSAGVRYTKVFDNAVSVRAGLNYSQINEKFIYFNPNEIKYITVITTRVVIRQPGDTLYINDTLQYQQTGTRTKTTYNKYRTIDVPLVVGYELGNGKIHANINAGVIINLYAWYKGDVLDSAYQPVSITSGKNNSVYQFKKNIGVGFLGSVSVYYKLTDDLHIFLEPYFRYNLSPMSQTNLNLQQKIHTAGLHAGVRFEFEMRQQNKHLKYLKNR